MKTIKHNITNTAEPIKPGYKKTSVGIIPEDWEVKKLGEIGTVINGLTYSPDDIRDEGTLVLRSSNVQNGALSFDDNVYVDTGDLKFNPVKKNDILICVRNGSKSLIGKNALIPKSIEGVAFGAFMSVYRSKTNNYLFQFFGTDEYQRQIHRNLGATINSINNNELKEFKLPIPPLAEQTAIADCLSTWDSGIEKLSALITAKKEQKKGLMQGIFSGKLKVENGELVKVEDEKLWLKGWKKVRLGDLGKTFNGLTGKTKDDFGVGLPFVSYLNVFRNNKIEENTSFDYVNIESSENQNTLNYGDLIFTTSSETPNEVGISSVVLFKPKEKLYLNSFCFGMRLNDFSILKPEYAVYLLRGQNFRREMYKLAQGSTRYNLSKASFVKIQITVPSLEEQTAIAEILQTADKEIELLEKKLEAFKIQKKGLMQVLLTGERRLV